MRALIAARPGSVAAAPIGVFQMGPPLRTHTCAVLTG